jgi:hypothetical protein
MAVDHFNVGLLQCAIWQLAEMTWFLLRFEPRHMVLIPQKVPGKKNGESV